MKWNKADILTIYRIGAEVGLIDAKSIIKWADSKIEHTDISNENFLIDLSLSGKGGINETIHILKINESNPNYELVWQTLYGLIKYQLDNKVIDLKRACYAISSIANQIKNETEYDLFGMELDDSFYLASRGVTGNVESIKETLSKYTSSYFDLGREFIEQELRNKNEA
jgi:hypothetical protein